MVVGSGASRSSLLVLLGVVACSGDPATRPAPEEATRRAIHFELASGVYIGDGLALTNHHLVSSSWRAAAITGRPLRPEQNFSQLTESEQHRSLRQSYYCFENGPSGVTVALANTALDPLCVAVDNSAMLRGRVGEQPLMTTELLFTMETLDLAVLAVDTPVDEPLIPVGSAAVGSEVVIGGYPNGVWALTSCVISRPVDLVRDPDPRIPERLRWTIPSLTLACPAGVITYGASGSGVYDKQTGELLGLVWAGSVDSTEVYVTPVDQWLPALRGIKSLENSSLAAWF